MFLLSKQPISTNEWKESFFWIIPDIPPEIRSLSIDILEIDAFALDLMLGPQSGVRLDVLTQSDLFNECAFDQPTDLDQIQIA